MAFDKDAMLAPTSRVLPTASESAGDPWDTQRPREDWSKRQCWRRELPGEIHRTLAQVYGETPV